MQLIYNFGKFVPLAVIPDIFGWYARDGYWSPEEGDYCKL